MTPAPVPQISSLHACKCKDKRKQTNRQAKKQIEGKHAKRQARKRCQTGANKHVIKQKGGVLGGQM